MLHTADEFARAMIDAGLSSAEEVQELWASFAAGTRPEDGETLSRILVERDRLTPLQAAELLASTGMPLVLGDYVLLAKIGAGGMGQVFKAHHRRLDRDAAIKLLPASLTKDPAAVLRFEREVKAAARLSHPNIVQTYDASVQDGVWYLVMEYVAGTDLATLVARDGPLPVERAIDCIRQAARGLAYAHSQGIVHRDVKPANLLVDQQRVVKILDLGLARFQDAAALDGLTQSGQVMGTVDYMAPEQAFDTRAADARADVYALGCTLHRLLSGKPMYGGDSIVQKLMAHQQQPIPRLAVARGDVPARLEGVFARMVAKRPDERFQTMTDVEAALAAVAAAVPSVVAAGRAPSSTSLGSAAEPTQALEDPFQATRSITVAAADPPRRSPAWQRAAAWIATAGLAAGLAIALLQRGPLDDAPPPTASGAAGLSSAAVLPPPAVAPFDAAAARLHQDSWANRLGVQAEMRNSIGMTFMLIPPGEFSMGSTPAELESFTLDAERHGIAPGSLDRPILESETPRHRVVLTKPLWMAATEVTIGQFALFVEAEGHVTLHETLLASGQEQGLKGTWRDPLIYPVTEHVPVTLVAFADAAAFCNWLSRRESLRPCYERVGADWRRMDGDGYRLPTEAEWEYACRAGSTTRFCFGDEIDDLDHHAWTSRNAGNQAHPVAQLHPNAFGLFDMPGNVWELCQDAFDRGWYAASGPIDPGGPESPPTELSLRGGSWFAGVNDSRSAARGRIGPEFRWPANGFRVVRVRIEDQTTPASAAVTGRAGTASVGR